jgi:phage terminase large subunit-like protein
MLQNPLAGQQRMFDIADLRLYEVRPQTLMVYILCDPGRSKKTDSDNTAYAVIGMDYAGNKYLVDGFRHKMDLMERWQALEHLYKKWSVASGVQGVKVGYESFGAQSDLDYFREQQRLKRLSFTIEELDWPRDGNASKIDRVQRLTPDLRRHKFFIPYPTDDDRLTSMQRTAMHQGHEHRISRKIIRKGQDSVYDLTEDFKMELHYFPLAGKKDLVDAVSRIYDIDPIQPGYGRDEYVEPEYV